MKQRAYQVAYPAVLVILMTAFVSTLFLAHADTSFAATAKKKSPEIARITAVEHTEAQIQKVQSALDIKESQEALWKELTQVMRDNAKEMDAITIERTENIKSMNSVERMKFHRQATEAQLNHLNKLIPPFEALYSSMSDDQKKITDAIFRTGKHDKHRKKK